MTWDQVAIFTILGGSLAAFAWGRWRYDLVAVVALLASVAVGIVPDDRAFLGFGHPAVVTVVAVLVVGKGLERSGVVGLVSRRLLALGHRPLVQLAILSGLVLVASSVINNVGALALFLPVALRVSRETGQPPSRILMPLAFASLLGGLTTLIGTPPNIIISSIREEATGVAFGMFSFSPVGVAVAVACFAFMVGVGWRLVPSRRGGIAPDDLFDVGRYITELHVPDRGPTRTIGEVVSGVDLVVVGLIRAGVQSTRVSMRTELVPGDIVIVEGDPAVIDELAAEAGLELAGGAGGVVANLDLLEAVVAPRSQAVGRDAISLGLRAQFGVNLLGVARAGERIHQRLATTVFRAGDVLLLQGDQTAMRGAVAALGLLPLAPRQVGLGTKRRVALGGGLFLAAVVATVAGLAPVQISFVAAAVAMVATRLITLEQAYQSVDFPVVVLLGAMLPVGVAFAETGGADLVADWMASLGGPGHPVIVLAGLIVVVMLLSNIVNNAAAAVVAAPIALRLAEAIEVSPDPMLMGVAIGASLPLLTPIGHQSNLLVMAPGGYRFGDYWRLGLPMSVLAVAVASVGIAVVWPFAG